jgi:hypothetical protein
MKPLVIRGAVVAALGGLIFGFDTAVISGAVKQIQGIPARRGNDAACGTRPCTFLAQVRLPLAAPR